mmetsp:Transcript_67002/g.155522  ORF Transcript_67002/g.155522 Transcript_67002/m.155522 type:complete len:312 (+) Transcript_67002:112-1047(+)
MPLPQPQPQPALCPAHQLPSWLEVPQLRLQAPYSALSHQASSQRWWPQLPVEQLLPAQPPPAKQPLLPQPLPAPAPRHHEPWRKRHSSWPQSPGPQPSPHPARPQAPQLPLLPLLPQTHSAIAATCSAAHSHASSSFRVATRELMPTSHDDFAPTGFFLPWTRSLTKTPGAKSERPPVMKGFVGAGVTAAVRRRFASSAAWAAASSMARFFAACSSFSRRSASSLDCFSPSSCTSFSSSGFHCEARTPLDGGARTTAGCGESSSDGSGSFRPRLSNWAKDISPETSSHAVHQPAQPATTCDRTRLGPSTCS